MSLLNFSSTGWKILFLIGLNKIVMLCSFEIFNIFGYLLLNRLNDGDDDEVKERSNTTSGPQ